MASELDIRKHCQSRMKALVLDQSSWLSHWRELSDYILPRRGRFLYTANQNDKGRKLNSKIINSTGTIAARVLAAGLMSGITSPARPWFRLTLSDKRLAKSPAVRAWLDAVQDTLLRIFARSNFYNALGVAYEELGVFGTASVMALEDYEDVARFYVMTAGEYWLGASNRGVVDTHYRRFPFTIGALVQEYGLENVSEQSRMHYKAGTLDLEVIVVHAIEPNDSRVLDVPDARNMKWRSIHYEEAASDTKNPLLRVSGFRNFPAMCPRWHLTGNDVYGRCPGMDALPDIKALQSMEKDKARAIALSVKPPMGGPPQLQSMAHGAVPGSVTYSPPGPNGDPTFKPLFQIDPRINELMQDLQAKEEQVRRAFYADLFLMISQLEDVRSATEIVERREEKLLQLGPMLERLHDELLDPLIKRVMEIAENAATSDRSILPPRPDELQGQDIEIEYVSTLSAAQRATGTASIERFVSFVGRIGAAKPEALDRLDVDETIDAYGDLVMVPSAIVVPIKTAAAERQARAQAAAAKQALETSLAAVKGAEVASKIDVGGGRNAIQAALGG